MRALDRIILIMLVLGIWALVLKPQTTDAHHQDDDGHSCQVNGSAFGETSGQDVEIYDWGGVSVYCTHY